MTDHTAPHCPQNIQDGLADSTVIDEYFRKR